MKIACEFGEYEVLGYREPNSQRIDRAVSLQSLVDNLQLSFRKLPTAQGIRYVEIDGNILVPIQALNSLLKTVGAPPEVLNLLAIRLSDRSTYDVGFLSYAHIQLQESLTALSGYYTETGMDAEYPVDEVEDTLYQIYCEFLTCGAYDPLSMTRDRNPMTASEAWMLSILETTTAALIYQFIEDKSEPDSVLTYLQIRLKERVGLIGSRIAEMAATFMTPEDL